MVDAPLPSFKKPPIVESVLGVQFEPVIGLTNAHLGAFWKTLGADWPSVTDAGQVSPQFERFGESQVWSLDKLKIRLAETPPARVQVRNVHGDRMLQLQNSRFHYNWIGTGDAYVRYNVLRAEFDRHYELFLEFLQREDLKLPRLNQWEVTYVNQLPKGSVWNDPSDWQRMFPALGAPRERVSGTRLESISGAWHFEIEPERGRLHVELTHGRAAGPTGKEVLTFKLTARGPIPPDAQARDFDAGFTLGHDIIVRGFTEMTSVEAREHWEQIT